MLVNCSQESFVKIRLGKLKIEGTNTTVAFKMEMNGDQDW